MQAEIKDKVIRLRRGQNQKVSEITGYPVTYVYQVLNGKRNNSDVLDAAKKVAINDLETRKTELQQAIAHIDQKIQDLSC